MRFASPEERGDDLVRGMKGHIVWQSMIKM
jgi:hypothetical protein